MLSESVLKLSDVIVFTDDDSMRFNASIFSSSSKMQYRDTREFLSAILDICSWHLKAASKYS